MSPMRLDGGMPKASMMALPTPFGSGSSRASSAASSVMRIESSSIIPMPRRFFSARLVVMSARDRQSRSERCVPISRAKRRTALSVQVVQDEEADGIAQRVVGGEQTFAALELFEHARADLGVAEEVHLSVGAEGPRLDLADVVEQRGPPHLETRLGLHHDLLGVLPDVFVTEFAVAETDHALHLGEEGVEDGRMQQRVETLVGAGRQHHAVEATPDVEPRNRL